MSIHIELSEEAREQIRKQKTTATITSILISLLCIALLGTVLGLLTILIPAKEVETIISYQAPVVEEESTNEPKVRVQQRQVPTPPSAASAVANVITTTAPTSVSIPDTNMMTNVESPDFGAMDDFGMGFGMEEAMSSSTSFFGAKVSGTKICYVIDYSLSMRGKRDELMRKELVDSLSNLQGGADYSLLFWAGAVWQAGDSVTLNQDKTEAIVSTSEGESYRWITKKGTQNWKPDGKRQEMVWTKPSATNIDQSIAQIKSTSLVWGTHWQHPLEYALDVNPAPDVIIFMTDGSSGKESLQIAEDMARVARRKSIVINTVALMEPKAGEGMKLLAEKTGGTAMMVMNESEIKDLITGEVTNR